MKKKIMIRNGSMKKYYQYKLNIYHEIVLYCIISIFRLSKVYIHVTVAEPRFLKGWWTLG